MSYNPRGADEGVATGRDRGRARLACGRRRARSPTVRRQYGPRSWCQPHVVVCGCRRAVRGGGRHHRRALPPPAFAGRDRRSGGVTQVGAMAAWTGPALVVAIVARVTSGGPEAPLFILAVLAAPLLALLAEPAPGALPSPAALPIGLVMAVCVLGSSIRAMTDLGHILGWPTWGTLGSAVVLVFLVTLWAAHGCVSLVALGLGVGALLAAVVGFGHVVDASPWAAWSRAASRSAFELPAGSPWTREGFQALEPVSLTLTEPRQLTVMTPGVYRVTEHDRAQPIIREWRLSVGDSLVLRPGDT